jgi:hypothetical protein
VLHLVASRKFQKRLHEGRLEPPEFSPHLQERLQAIYCENCDTLWQLVPDAEFETQKALVGSP